MGNTAQVEQFIPHGMCFLWNVRLLALHVISDGLIALAYFSIPVILLFFVRKRRDLPFPAVFTMFGLFIVACGMTHVLDIWTIWHPVYWLSGGVKAATACVSLATAVLLVRIIPKALAIKSRADLYEQLGELNATLERKVHERTAAMRESERFLHAVTDNIPAWVAYWDTDLRCRYANAASLRGFGRTLESTLNLHMSELLPPGGMAYVAPFVASVLAGEPQTFEFEHARPDGTNSFALAHYIPDPDGDTTRGFYAIVSDITDFKESEAQLADLNEHLRARTAEAETATLFKSQFLANMSHEIRSPMNAILGMLQLLRTTGLAPRQEDYAAKAYTATQALLRLLSDILDFSKIEAGKLTFENAPFEIEALVRDMSSLLSVSLGSKPIEIVFVIDEHLPKRLQGDVFRLRQVLLNLAGNAIKFTARGEIVIEMRQIAHASERCEVAFSVSDTGSGIAPEQQAAIFESFRQGEASTTRRSGGSGLGLTISRDIVSLMGGQLAVESELGVGSRFHFTLAFDRANDDAAETSPPDRTQASPRPNRLGGLNVLVVDDFAVNLQIAAELLSIEGARVATARSGRDAIDKVLRSRTAFDVVLMDVQMPEMDGYETTRRLRELPHVTATIVAMTANAMEPDEAACLAAGMDGYIPKPIDIEVVVRTLLDLTRRAQALDVASALRRMENNRSLFASVAGRFIEESERLIAKLRALLQIGALSDAADVLHQLKGFAATVGNAPLAELASTLETELKRTSRLSDAANDLARLDALAAAGNTELKRVLSDSAPPPPARDEVRTPEASTNREQMSALSTLLVERNLGALDVYRELAPALQASLPAERNAVLAAAMDTFDFAAAAHVLDAMELTS
jgi:PAS domain S-box-containing protein